MNNVVRGELTSNRSSKHDEGMACGKRGRSLPQLMKRWLVGVGAIFCEGMACGRWGRSLLNLGAGMACGEWGRSLLKFGEGIVCGKWRRSLPKLMKGWLVGVGGDRSFT